MLQATAIKFSLKAVPEEPILKELHYELVSAPYDTVFTNNVVIIEWPKPATQKMLMEFINSLNNPNALLQTLPQLASMATNIKNQWRLPTAGSEELYSKLLSRVQEGAEKLSRQVYFIDSEDATYEAILGLAKTRLRKQWYQSTVARTLFRKVCGYHNKRKLLKTAKPSLNINSRIDIQQYIRTHRLSDILTLDNFNEYETNILTTAFTRTFRGINQLNAWLTKDGLLTHDCTFAWWMHFKQPEENHRFYCHFNPETKKIYCRSASSVAGFISNEVKDIINQIKVDNGRYAFTTTFNRLGQYIKTPKKLQQSIYKTRLELPKNTSRPLQVHKITTYYFKPYGVLDWPIATIADLKAILKRYEISQTGNKDALRAKISELVVAAYKKEKKNLDKFFTNTKFNINTTSPRVSSFSARVQRALPYDVKPITHTHAIIDDLIFELYCTRHSRGGVIIDPSYTDTSVDAVYIVNDLQQTNKYSTLLPLTEPAWLQNQDNKNG